MAQAASLTTETPNRRTLPILTKPAHTPVQATATRPDPEYDTHLAQRCRCCRLLLAYRRDDRHEALIASDHPYQATLPYGQGAGIGIKPRQLDSCARRAPYSGWVQVSRRAADVVRAASPGLQGARMTVSL